MPKSIRENLDHPRDLAPAALQFLINDGFQTIDGECVWQNEKWKYSIYKVEDQPGLIIRIDMRKA